MSRRLLSIPVSFLAHVLIVCNTDENILNSTIPTELGRLTRLQYLDFHTNWFLRGTLPTELGLLTELAVFNVSMS